MSIISRCGLALLGGALLVPGRAEAAFPQKTCSESFSSPINVSYGAVEFDKDLSATQNYGKNELFSWTTHVTSNVLWMNPHLLSWNTELNFDWLKLNNEHYFTGNLGTLWWGTSYGAIGGLMYAFEWRSDSSITRAGYPQIDQMKFTCLPAASQTTTAPLRGILVNTRYDAVYFNSQDILYFSASLPFAREMVIQVDMNAGSSSADFDIYASTSTSRPDDTNFMWRAYRGGSSTPGRASEALIIPAGGSIFQPRTIYFGVRNAVGTGHVSVRANIPSQSQTLTICTQDMTPAQVMAHAGWPNARETIRRTLLRVNQMTNGNYWIDNVQLKLQAAGLESTWTVEGKYCRDDNACDWCMGAYGISTVGNRDGCGFQAQNDPNTGKVRIPHVRCQGSEVDPGHASDRNYDAANVVNFSRILAHESGHGLARMYTHTNAGILLSDYYGQCSHTIMNGPQGPVDTSYRFSTTFNHCKPSDPVPTPTCPATSNWTTLSNSGHFAGFTWPLTTASSQPWLHAHRNVAAGALITFTGI